MPRTKLQRCAWFSLKTGSFTPEYKEGGQAESGLRQQLLKVTLVGEAADKKLGKSPRQLYIALIYFEQ